jgi:hypothetical protein
VTATCPAGKVLLGGGGEITGGFGEVLMDDMAPVPFENKFTVTGYEDSAYAPNWTVTAYAICSAPRSGLERLNRTSVSDSTDKSVSVACSSLSKLLVSASGKITGGLGEVVMEEIQPVAFLSSYVMAREEDPYSPNWTVTAHIVCVNPSAFARMARVPVRGGRRDLRRLTTRAERVVIRSGSVRFPIREERWGDL